MEFIFNGDCSFTVNPNEKEDIFTHNFICEDGSKLTIKSKKGKIIEFSKSSPKVPISTLNIGDKFKIGDCTFIVLEQTICGTKVTSDDFTYTGEIFGDCSDWKVSPIRTFLNNGYYNKIEYELGKNNILPIKRDLTSLDGLDDYGSCVDKISMLSAQEYAKYHKILGLESDYHNGWWTITPFSVPSNNYSSLVCHISRNGSLNWDNCDFSLAVRPFFMLEPSTIVDILKEDENR